MLPKFSNAVEHRLRSMDSGVRDSRSNGMVVTPIPYGAVTSVGEHICHTLCEAPFARRYVKPLFKVGSKLWQLQLS